MGGDVPNVYVVELEYVLYEFLFVVVDGALFAAGVHHHAYLFLTHLIVRLIGVNAAEAQHKVGGGGEEPYYGFEDHRNSAHKAGNAKGKLLRLFHGDALWHKLAEYQRKVGQYEGYEYYGDGVKGSIGDAYPFAQYPVHQRL